ncbi:protein of unknown function DUF305 [Cellulomonas flavigena DSM 20109]|uniref:DUF305 domain-containing protein n=1 Tax=Cellulomonas flavigena (strain ATCC 482 / DSM 20109 / BCRC 11376 / JCM 18109 / NBRC 3775 / NCIMB 8073 / NRS 134) TaxID=446466 RepID=D5UE65_CELFN|nr:DUF305 domain-containing protein [Cellulomonas flavigena]ADG76541.1 protein of unknown function DUF305 [Cellulomonas flavigena DSM 20109]
MKNRARRQIVATVAAAALTLSIAACSTGNGADPSPTGQKTVANAEASAGESTHNDSDTTFAQMMIVHHDGAIEMAQLAAGKAATPEVQDLGERIAAAQGPEIELMAGWLESWGEEPVADGMDGMDGMDHGGMDMEGMNHEDVMSELSSLSGTEFDTRFLELMIDHHRGAIEMAETEQADGDNPDALELAQKIVDDQTAEISTMETLLAQL